MAIAAAKQPSAARKFKHWFIGIVVVTSVIWTVIRWDSLSEIKDKIGQVAVFGGVMLINEVLFISGLLLITISLGHHVFVGTGKNPVRWVKAMFGVRKRSSELLHHISDSRTFRWGFNLNWIGAVGTGLIPSIGIVVILPYTSWGLAALPMLDVFASIGIRAPIQSKLNQLRNQEVAS